MKYIVGLGNPGEKYDRTRHNAGFMFIDRLLGRFEHFHLTKKLELTSVEAEIYSIEKGGEKLYTLIKPLSFMNLSGAPVKQIMKKLGEGELILAHDDLDIELGKYKVQMGKSPMGHNGINDIEKVLGTTDFQRVRLGVDSRETRDIPGEDYVLMKMTEDELVSLYEGIDEATLALSNDHNLF